MIEWVSGFKFKAGYILKEEKYYLMYAGMIYWKTSFSWFSFFSGS